MELAYYVACATERALREWQKYAKVEKGWGDSHGCPYPDFFGYHDYIIQNSFGAFRCAKSTMNVNASLQKSLELQLLKGIQDKLWMIMVMHWTVYQIDWQGEVINAPYPVYKLFENQLG